MNAYISIGNSDDKLTQKEWSWFVKATQQALQERWAIRGVWFSGPESEWQNANWCIELSGIWTDEHLRNQLRSLARAFRQDSIMLAVAQPEFVQP